MAKPFVIDLPHTLGRDEARRRIGSGIGKLKDHVPGAATVESAWAGDRMSLTVRTMGQEVRGHIDVEDSKVRLELMLPALLAMFGEAIRNTITRRGTELLEDKSRKG